jgi:hypothetical protein
MSAVFLTNLHAFHQNHFFSFGSFFSSSFSSADSFTFSSHRSFKLSPINGKDHKPFAIRPP